MQERIVGNSRFLSMQNIYGRVKRVFLTGGVVSDVILDKKINTVDKNATCSFRGNFTVPSLMIKESTTCSGSFSLVCVGQGPRTVRGRRCLDCTIKWKHASRPSPKTLGHGMSKTTFYFCFRKTQINSRKPC